MSNAVGRLLDGGSCKVGIQSTIVDLSSPTMRVLRPGAIGAQDIERVTGLSVDSSVDATLHCPGRMESHYAPRARVMLASWQQVPQQISGWRAAAARVGVLSAHRSST